jgi:hypothetical protein
MLCAPCALMLCTRHGSIRSRRWDRLICRCSPFQKQCPGVILQGFPPLVVSFFHQQPISNPHHLSTPRMDRRAPGQFREERRSRQEPAAAQQELVALEEPPQAWLCSICRDCVQTEPVVTPCRHSFCKSCLHKALAPPGPPTRGRCPMCRTFVAGMDAVQSNERAFPSRAGTGAPCRSLRCSPSQRCVPSWPGTACRAPTPGAPPPRCALVTGASTRTSARSSS